MPGQSFLMETVIFKEIFKVREINAVSVKDISSFCVRGAVSPFGVPQFLEKNAIDFPGKTNSSIQKKVLTKSMFVLSKEFKRAHLSVKMSFATFKRRRPHHIITSLSRKFSQCLCERCTNVMLLMDMINKKMNKRDRTLTIEDPLGKASDVGRLCIERQCTDCGVGSVMTDLCDTIGDKT
ncbi:hypothetical protein PoB_005391400 [Plakobranchus ocellatus]|uniref:Uncharacterized protein n=1 Tax=Plakobranchus ocellatus TaxID=259542 RepID=A0AAV4C4D4_9GAST|nr:hypothetical protein PoB_005391400 [Plakobranchus ocellatus]